MEKEYPKKILVSWDYYSKYMESHTIHVPNHQPVIYFPTNIALSLRTRFFWDIADQNPGALTPKL